MLARSHSAKVEKDIHRKIEVFSHKRAKEFDFDLLVTGHVHVQKDFSFEVGGKARRSVNLGYWDTPKAFKLTETSGEFVAF